MNKIQCIYPDRDAVLAGYLYDDIDGAERAAFDAHLAACRWCSDELAGLRGVRDTLGQWAPPEPARTFAGFEPRVTSPEPRAWWHTVPVWAQVAAAMLVLGASASIANLDIRYDRAGLSVRTGWSKPVPQAAQAPVATTAQDAAPWRADLAALQNQLRSEMRTASSGTAAGTTAASTTVAAASNAPAASLVPASDSMSDAEFRRRVRVMLDESEKRQKTELALRVAEVVRDVDAQRQADLAKIDRSLGYIQTNTYSEQLKQREMVNYLVKVAQKQ